MRRLVLRLRLTVPHLQMSKFGELPADLVVRPRPVLLAVRLNRWGHSGPAEIPAKRRQAYLYTTWLAQNRGLPFQGLARHPFNPLALPRLTIAAGATLETVRRVYEHVFGEGHGPGARQHPGGRRKARHRRCRGGDRRPDRQGRIGGESLTDAVRALDGLPVDAFLVNCNPTSVVLDALRELRAATNRPIGAYAPRLIENRPFPDHGIPAALSPSRQVCS